MRRSFPQRIVLSALLAALLAPTAARPEEESPKSKIKRRPANQTAPASQTQTAPADKSKPPAPGEAGMQDAHGMVIKVVPERQALILRTTTNDYQVFVTPQTVVLRNGQPVAFKEISPGDRVESCRFNAKKVVQKLSLTSAGKATGAAPPIPPKP